MTTTQTTSDKTTGRNAVRALKQLIKDQSTTAPVPVISTDDPAILGAARKGKTKVVQLGFDPTIANDVVICVDLKGALETAQEQYAALQVKVRDYGKAKHDAYNTAFNADTTTVCIPYKAEVPFDEESETPGFETRYVQVVCSNNYTVASKTALANKTALGTELYGKLFTEKTDEVLKPNAVELIKGILLAAGIKAADLDKAMESLFDKVTSVKVSENYSAEAAKAPETAKAILAQIVTRAAPSLRFPEQK
ncbi:MAG: hypothetical protein WC708_00285 [Lentisphaeria bacterium]|jgi:hypothetical protein